MTMNSGLRVKAKISLQSKEFLYNRVTDAQDLQKKNISRISNKII